MSGEVFGLVLDGAGVDPALAGGKGAALDELIGHGFTVPPTGVLTTASSRRFISATGIDVALARLESNPDDHPGSSAESVDAMFLAPPMPEDLRAEIAVVAGAVRDGGLLAVRSSATAEDLAGASFAGQYRSVLEVGDDADVERAVRLVWASLWHPAPRAYRRHKGVDEADLAMAVVIMRLVDARRAGVIFTVDPAGAVGSLRVEAVDGLAEQLVSGEVTPDAYVVPRRRSMRWASGLADDPVLDDVIEQALAVEHRFGCPMDVEWAYDGDRLFLVQARPITVAAEATGDEFDTAIGPDDTYTTAGVAEMLPGVLPPLVWTTIAPHLEGGFRTLFDSMGALPADAAHRPFLARINGRATLNLDLMRAAAQLAPGGSAEELERQYFGRVVSEDLPPASPQRGPFKGLRNAFRGAREIQARRRFRFESDTTIETIRQLLRDEHDLETFDDQQLVAYRNRLLDLAGRTVAAEVAVAAAAAASYGAVEIFLEGHLGREEAERLTQRLTAGGVRPCGAQLALNVCLLTALAMMDPVVTELLDDVDGSTDPRPLLARTQGGSALLAEFDREMRSAGSAAVFAGQTWAESSDLAWQLLRQSVEVERVGAREGLDHAQRTERIREVQALFASSVKYKVQRIMTGQVVDVRSRMLRRLVFDAVDFLDRREMTKSAVLALGGEVRRLHLEIGARLTARGLLARPDEVDVLDGSELGDALRGSGPSRWAIDQRVGTLRSHGEQDAPPQVFTGDPSRSLIAELEPDGDTFVGWAASAGCHEGPARVIRSAGDSLHPGDVLVARTTDPSWTPLFLTAGAIVVEEGGPLSHAAIIARELGLPAVLNVPGVVRHVEDGVRLEVDGSAGTVRLVDPGEAPPRPELGALDSSVVTS